MDTIIYDVIVIGAGPAGYATSLYTSRAKLKTLVFSGEQIGGQLMYTSEVENYPGAAEGTTGPILMGNMQKQSLKFGTKLNYGRVDSVNFETKPYEIFQGKEKYLARTVVITTGAEALRLNLANEDKFFGRGISVCAVCDAAFYKDKIAYVVGGGDAACEDSLALAKFADKIFLCVRREELRASKIMQERVINNSKIEILWNTEVIGIEGGSKLEGLIILNNKSNQKEEVKTDGLFYAIGHRPNTKLFEEQINISKNGYILIGLNNNKNGEEEWISGYPTMTNRDGIFAAGDCVDFRYRQASVSSGMGVMAAIDCEKWLSKNE